MLVALLAAKARALRGRPAEDAVRLVAYGSDQVQLTGLPSGHHSTHAQQWRGLGTWGSFVVQAAQAAPS